MTFLWRTGRAVGRQLRDVSAVLFEGSDTLVRTLRTPDGGPGRVVPAPRAAEAVAAVRDAGLPVGVMSARRRIGEPWHVRAGQESVRAHVGSMLGPFDTWQLCRHAAVDRCTCRTPAPRLVLQAAEALGVPSHRLAVLSDDGSDMKAAQAAGAVGILVPSARTLRADVAEVPLVAPDLISAVRAVLGVDRSWVPDHDSPRTSSPRSKEVG